MRFFYPFMVAMLGIVSLATGQNYPNILAICSLNGASISYEVNECTSIYRETSWSDFKSWCISYPFSKRV